MKKLLFVPLAFLLCAPLTGIGGEIASLDLKKCFENSSLGKSERTALEQLKKQFSDNIEKLESELETLSNHLQDDDYMSGLSEKASDEMNKKFEELSQEYNVYQSQYYQLLNQANARATQKLLKEIKAASLKVLQQENLTLIFNEEAILASKKGVDVTDKVLEVLEKDFDQNSKNSINNS